MFGLRGPRILIRTDRAGRREVVLKGRRDPLAAKVAAFVRELPIPKGTIRIRRVDRGTARLIFSRGIDQRLAQRTRNYVLSLSSR